MNPRPSFPIRDQRRPAAYYQEQPTGILPLIRAEPDPVIRNAMEHNPRRFEMLMIGQAREQEGRGRV